MSNQFTVECRNINRKEDECIIYHHVDGEKRNIMEYTCTKSFSRPYACEEAKFMIETMILIASRSVKLNN